MGAYDAPPPHTYRQPHPIDMTPARPTAEPAVDPNNLTVQLANVLRDTFGLEPKGRARAYQKPYPDHFDHVQYPRGFRVNEFGKFSGEDNRTTLEHVWQFLSQCGEASYNNPLKL